MPMLFHLACEFDKKSTEYEILAIAFLQNEIPRTIIPFEL
jgi:hypothetical protein